jgi:hypothetical protein
VTRQTPNAAGDPVSRMGATHGHGQYPAPPQSRTSIGTQSRRYRDFGVDEFDLIKLDCGGADYLIVSKISASGLMDRIRCIRGEWHNRKDNLLLANLPSQTHIFNTDPNYPQAVGMFVVHRAI